MGLSKQVRLAKCNPPHFHPSYVQVMTSSSHNFQVPWQLATGEEASIDTLGAIVTNLCVDG